MKYTVILPRSVEKELTSLPDSITNHIVALLEKLQDTPRPSGCKKLKGEDGWRIRLRNYRILYDIDDARHQIIIRKIGHRKDVYRDN